MEEMRGKSPKKVVNGGCFGSAGIEEGNGSDSRQFGVGEWFWLCRKMANVGRPERKREKFGFFFFFSFSFIFQS